MSSIGEIAKFRSSIQVDTINEFTSASGVTIDSMLIKDGKTSSNNIDWQEPTMFRNRIRNGNMAIDQRGLGVAGVANDSGSGRFAVDGTSHYGLVSSKFTAYQDASAPTGFTKSLKIVSSSSYSSGVNEMFMATQRIEGYNVADLAWGTSGAKAVTLSFWARSSLVGTHSGSISNSAENRCYVFTFPISVADTWEFKTVTIAGDTTTSTWLKDNGIGVQLIFNLGSGTNKIGTAGAWGSTLYYGATGSQSVVGTNGATFYITGVQLEPGTVATPFEFRPYGTELELCQRYYWKSQSAPNSNIQPTGYNGSGTNTIGLGAINFKTTMRISPDVTITGTWTTINCGQPAITGKSADGFHIYVISSAAGLVQAYNADAALQYIEAKAEL